MSGRHETMEHVKEALFVVMNTGWGSGKIRGRDSARITNSSVTTCDVADRLSLEPFTVVHVKRPCKVAFQRWPGAHHVFDRVDNFDANIATYNFSGEIFSDEAQFVSCRTKVCAVIPHHVNLACHVRPIPTAYNNPVIGFVGTQGKASVSIPKHLNASVLKEYSSPDPCATFYDKIDIAIAWKKEGYLRPAERFTNPIMFGIPTIGFARFRTFQHYKMADPFLCTTHKCVVQRLQGIMNGSLSKAFRKLRDEVRRDVDGAQVAKLYRSMFTLLARTSSRRVIAPLS